MKPVLYCGSIFIHTYNLMFFVAFIILTICVILSGKKAGYKITELIFVCMSVYIFGFIFAILIFKLLHIKSLLSLQIGVTSYGGVLGFLIVIAYYSKITKISFLNLADFFIIFAPLVYAIGRLGCYFAGCCRGIETNVLWSVVFPHTQISVHPVQLYDSYLNFLLFLFLIEYKDKKRFDGQLFLLFLLGNSIIRFFVEYFRWGVSAKVVYGVITQAQIASIAIILGSLVFWKMLETREKIDV